MMRNALTALACVGFTACSDMGPDVGLLAELEQARARWESARPTSYVFAVERLCFCGLESRGPARVRVQGDIVIERVYVDTGAPVPASFADSFPTVNGLFDLLRSAIEGGAHEVRVTYDPVLGVPEDFWIDYLEYAIDEELGIRVTEEVQAVP